MVMVMTKIIVSKQDNPFANFEDYHEDASKKRWKRFWWRKIFSGLLCSQQRGERTATMFCIIITGHGLLSQVMMMMMGDDGDDGDDDGDGDNI